MQRFFALIFALSVLSGCSKPTDTIIPSDASAWDKELKPAVAKLPDEDKAKLTAFLMRSKMGEAFGGANMPVGLTIGQALAEQDKFVAAATARAAEAAALKKKLEAESAVALETLNKLVTGTLIKKEELDVNYQARQYSQTQVFKIGIKNNADKKIVGVAGELKFIDVFGKKVAATNFKISENIEPGASITWTGSRDYNQFLPEHKAMWNLEEGKYTARFLPSAVVFADGTKVAGPE